MPGTVLDRLRCLRQGIFMPLAIQPPLSERLWRPFEWYGLSRRRIRRELVQVEQSEHAILYGWQGYLLWWPREADINRLVAMFVELFVPVNPHYFTPAGLGLWPVGAVVIDVGSCEGLFALRAAREMKAGFVVAIEPGRLMAQLLKRTFDVNKLDCRMSVVQCLAGKLPGLAGFSECLADPTQARVMPAGTSGDVEIKTLDAIAGELGLARVDVIKIDAEGADFDILQGAEAVIKKWRPMLLVTTYHDVSHAQAMRSWLEELRLGYQFTFRGITTMGTRHVRPVLMLAVAH